MERILYLCNGKRCREVKGKPGYSCYYEKDAKYHYCKHTYDINYAKSFVKRECGSYKEIEPTDCEVVDDGK